MEALDKFVDKDKKYLKIKHRDPRQEEDRGAP